MFLTVKNVKKFDDHSEDPLKIKNKVNKTQKLQIAIEYATKIKENQMSFTNIKELNNEIFQVVKEKDEKNHVKSNFSSNFQKKIKIIEKIVQQGLNCEKKTENYVPTEEDLEEILFSLIYAQDNYDNPEEICDSLLFILGSFPQINPKVIKMLKFYYKSITTSPKKSIQKTAELIKKICFAYKKLKVNKTFKDEIRKIVVPNKTLRKHVCRKFTKIINSKISETNEAKIRAIEVEEFIRRNYPEMGENYYKKCKSMIKELKQSFINQ